MAEKYKDYPLYSYNEPATYDDFSGGINSDPSNEHLMANEMRDCVNMTYLSGALVKRQGAKVLNRVHYDGDNVNKIQGVFLYTNNDPGENGNRFKISYLIVAGDGKLFYGPYEKNGDIHLKRLHIKRKYERGNRVYDFTNPWCDLPETENRDGYRITSVIKWKENSSWPNMHDEMEDELVFQNYRPIEAATINENILTKRSADDAEGALTNKLYIATGTKLVMVYFDYNANDLVATAVEPYVINGTEMQNIGENYMSPYNGLCKGTQNNTVTTSVYGMQVEKVYRTYKIDDDDIGDHLPGTYRAKVNGKYPTSFTLYPLMNIQKGDNRNNYYYKWEKRVGTNWYTIIPFADQFTQDVSKYWEWIETPLLYKANEISTEYYGDDKPYITDEKQELGDLFFVDETVNEEELRRLYKKTGERYENFTVYDTTLYSPSGSSGNTKSYTGGKSTETTSVGAITRTITYYRTPTAMLIDDLFPSAISQAKDAIKSETTYSSGEQTYSYGIYDGKYVLTISAYIYSTYTEKTFSNDTKGIIYASVYLKCNGTIITSQYDTTQSSTTLFSNGYDIRYETSHSNLTFKNTNYETTVSTIFGTVRFNSTAITKTKDKAISEWANLYTGNYREITYNPLHIPTNGTVEDWEGDENAETDSTEISYPKDYIVINKGLYYRCRQDQPNIFKEFMSLGKPRYYEISVDDLDETDKDGNQLYDYRVTFAKSFESEPSYITEFATATEYHVGDYVSYAKKTYICVNEITTATYPNGAAFATEITITENNGTTKQVIYWKEVPNLVDCLYYIWDETTRSYKVKTDVDFVVDKIDGEYFGQAQAGVWSELKPSEKFKAINSCNRIIADGNKLLLYGDTNYSGWWYKSVISNPGYFTDRGCLSFKTTKNEQVIKVVPFQGNIIIFANNPELGGSIHLVSGNGDDYDPGGTQSYYSPYQRKTINSAVSCSNGNTVQVCDNILVFKYYDRLYYIAASDLNQDIVNVTSCNDRVKTNRDEYAIKWGKTLYDTNIPWDDDSCVSEVTDTYYGILWPAKFDKDEYGEEYMVHPGIRAKMYYKMANQIKDNSYVFPWLKDVSDGIFDAKNIINLKGRPVYYFHDQLVSMSEKVYNDLGIDYPCKIQLRGVDLNYPKLYKMIDSVILYYHRNQYKTVDIKAIIKNEAGYKLIDETDTNRLKSIGDFKSLRAGENNQFIEDSNFIKVGGDSIADTKVINPAYKFPCLLADFTIEANCPSIEEQERREDKLSGVFSLSSVTFRYTTIEAPDTTPIDLYKNIIRPREI